MEKSKAKLFVGLTEYKVLLCLLANSDSDEKDRKFSNFKQYTAESKITAKCTIRIENNNPIWRGLTACQTWCTIYLYYILCTYHIKSTFTKYFKNMDIIYIKYIFHTHYSQISQNRLLLCPK